MNGEILFRILFLVLFVPGISVRGYYTAKVRATRKRRSWKERLKDTVQAEGKTGAILLIGQGIYLIVVVPVYLLFSPSLPWFDLPIVDWQRWIGVVVGILSLPFLAWVHYTLDKHWDVSLSLRKDHALVTSGPYRQIRHPMYTVHIVYFLLGFWFLLTYSYSSIIFLQFCLSRYGFLKKRKCWWTGLVKNILPI